MVMGRGPTAPSETTAVVSRSKASTTSATSGRRRRRATARASTEKNGAGIALAVPPVRAMTRLRSEEHTSELQSRGHLVCRLLLEKKKRIHTQETHRHATTTE